MRAYEIDGRVHSHDVVLSNRKKPFSEMNRHRKKGKVIDSGLIEKFLISKRTCQKKDSQPINQHQETQDGLIIDNATWCRYHRVFLRQFKEKDYVASIFPK